MWGSCTGQRSSRRPKEGYQRVSGAFYLHIPLADVSSAPSIHFTDIFAFGAPKVVAYFITIWMMTYGDKVIVCGMPSGSCVPSLLYSSDIGRHTSILFLNNIKGEQGQDTIRVARYAWEHDRQRPNTHTFPIACPVCHVVYPWNCAGFVVQKGCGKRFTLTCHTKLENGGNCSGEYTIDGRPSSTIVEAPYIGSWYSYNLNEGMQ